MTFNEILAMFSPLTLTESINQVRTDEPLTLTRKLGTNIQQMWNKAAVYETEDANYALAPLGYSGDPAVNVDIQHKTTQHVVIPPQIYMVSRITADEIEDVRRAGQNPINMTKADKESAFFSLFAIKQRGMRTMIDRTVEWMFAQALNGKIKYDKGGRKFEHDYELTQPIPVPDLNKWTASDSNPIHDLREWATKYRGMNQQLPPDLVIMGAKAATAFLNHPVVEDWMKTPAYAVYYPFKSQAEFARGESQPIGILDGMELFEYSGTYEEGVDSKGRATTVPFIDQDTVYLTNRNRWRLYYGAISNFKSGSDSPLIARPFFSMINYSNDGKALDIYAESRPLPVIVSNTSVLRAKVVA